MIRCLMNVVCKYMGIQMSIKKVITSQYREKVEQVASQLRSVTLPPEGWLRTVRKALSMSAAQLGRRLGKTRALISNTEKAELNGGVTLKTMRDMAQAMECRFVYAIVPKTSTDDILEARALEKARQSVLETSKHMALEEQSLSQKKIEFEIERVKQEILKELPGNFWNDED